MINHDYSTVTLWSIWLKTVNWSTAQLVTTSRWPKSFIVALQYSCSWYNSFRFKMVIVQLFPPLVTVSYLTTKFYTQQSNWTGCCFFLFYISTYHHWRHCKQYVLSKSMFSRTMSAQSWVNVPVVTCPAAPSPLHPSDLCIPLCSSLQSYQSRTCRFQKDRSHSLPNNLGMMEIFHCTSRHSNPLHSSL